MYLRPGEHGKTRFFHRPFKRGKTGEPEISRIDRKVTRPMCTCERRSRSQWRGMYSLLDLVRSIIDFTPYVRKLVEDFAGSELAWKFIEPYVRQEDKEEMEPALEFLDNGCSSRRHRRPRSWAIMVRGKPRWYANWPMTWEKSTWKTPPNPCPCWFI